MRLPLGASVDAGLGRLVVMPDLDDVAVWVAEICGAFRQVLGPERVLTSWHEIYCLSNQSSCERCIISGVHGQTDVIDGPPAGIATGKVLHERHCIPVYQVKYRHVVDANAGERCRAFLKFLLPHRPQAHNIDKETEGDFRAIHPEHDVVNVHDVSVSPLVVRPAAILYLESKGDGCNGRECSFFNWRCGTSQTV